MLFFSVCTYAQEENPEVNLQGRRYVDIRIKKLEKSANRISRAQTRLLKKLSKREKTFANKLRKTDSSLYLSYLEDKLSFDSIGKIAKNYEKDGAFSFIDVPNRTVDSLRKITSFCNSTQGSVDVGRDKMTERAHTLGGKLNFNNYVDALINEKVENLKDMAELNANLPGLGEIEKEVFYGKSNIAAIKAIANDPNKAEEKALEYLQGVKGFEQMFSSYKEGMQLPNNADLVSQGYQTNSLLQSSFAAKYGAGTSAITEKLNSSIADFQDKKEHLATTVGNAKEGLTNLKKSEKIGFKINPVRGVPFMQRLEKTFNWQASRPSADNSVPALFTGAVSVGYKQTSKMIYGLGFAAYMGLGESWQRVHFSLQGVGTRIFYSWQLPYSISAYTEYERTFKKYFFTHNATSENELQIPTAHSTLSYSESMLIGFSKKYNLNKKYNGAIQILYDIWWQDKGQNNPIVIRFLTIKK